MNIKLIISIIVIVLSILLYILLVLLAKKWYRELFNRITRDKQYVYRIPEDFNAKDYNVDNINIF